MRELAETVLFLHKEKNGFFDWNSLDEETKKTAPIQATKVYLMDAEYVQMRNRNNPSYTTLTPKGWKFDGFDKEDEAAEEEKRVKRLSDNKLEIDLKNAKRVYKTYPVTQILAWIGAITGILLILLRLAELFGWLPKSK